MKQLFTAIFLLAAALTAQAYDPQTDSKLTGRVISSPGRDANLAFDNKPSTSFSANRDEMQWVGLELDQPYVITRIAFCPEPTSQGVDAMQLSVFEGANRPDFMDAVPLYLIAEKPAREGMTAVDVNVSRGFRYVRYVGSSGSYCRVAELEFYGHAGEGDDSQFYQVTNLPTVSIHVKDEANPWNKGEEFEAMITNIYDDGTHIQEYPITTHVRGNYSSTHPNKPFRVKFADGKSHRMLKDSPDKESTVKAKKWVLLNSYRDKTLMRNPVAWNVSKRVGPKFTPWSQPVDLLLNGDYHGTYILADHVDVRAGRIDVTEMEPTDIEGEALTGGYYFEADNNYGSEPYHWLSAHGNTMSLHDPDEKVVQPQQFNYIKNYFGDFEDRLFSESYTDPTKGYRNVFDIESFLRYFLISEFNGNTDMICQVFMYKERGDDLIYTGPVWDHELALENDQTVYPGNDRADWTYPVRATGNFGSVVSRVLSDPTAMARLQEIWAEVRDDSLITVKAMSEMVDSFRVDMRASANLNFLRWPYLLQHLSLNPNVWGSWEAEVDNVQRYVSGRVAWMDKKLSYSQLDTLGGVYQIYTSRDFYQFSCLVQQGEYSAKARLRADIDMSKYSDRFIPLGTSSNPYAGTIDGAGHTISNLHISGGDYTALIAHAGSGCVVRNLTLGKDCEVKGKNYVAGFIGNLRSGAITLENCGFEGTVEASEVNAAALVGYARRSTTIRLSDCYNAGTIRANNRAAALVPPVSAKIIGANLYNCGRIDGVEEEHGFAYSDISLKLTNCYDLHEQEQVTLVSADSVDNGWLCQQLNDGRAKTVWFQNLDNGRPHDEHPVLDNTHGNVFYEDGHFTNLRQMKEAYRYYRLDITDVCAHGVIQFAEFDLLDSELEELPLTVYKGTESTMWGENWPNVADDRVDTKYCASFNEHAQFLFDAGEEVNIYGYRIYTANDTQSYPWRNPHSWCLYGSNSYTENYDDASWQLIDEQTNDTRLGATNYTPYDYLVRTPQPTVRLDRHTMRLTPDSVAQLNATILPEVLSGARLTWRSTDENVAVVVEGAVKANAVGRALVIAQTPDYGQVADTCRVIVLDETVGFRYYQLEILENHGDGAIQLSEFDFIDEHGRELPSLSVYEFFAEYFKNETPALMVDNKVDTKYCGSLNSPVYIFMDAGETVAPVAYRMYTANDTKKYPGRNPKHWRLWGSQELNSQHDHPSWTLIDERTDDQTMQATNFTPYDFVLDYDFLTAIEEVNGESTHAASPSQVYDLTGRRMPDGKLRRGIYIVGGKKYNVKTNTP